MVTKKTLFYFSLKTQQDVICKNNNKSGLQ